ncbi:hypothetical protein [Alteribacillus sp. YIM 98480]|uniref:hypothetical protein n=1 Tax=Alteribacillus sp. YIM 98480 TaxID=2606599 RepID=UPI00131D3D1B|nr:hypothetical protein [Alteribacillus sp. YIM 98480]
MMTEIYQYLNADTELCELLEHSPQEERLKIFLGRPQSFSPHQVNDKGSFIDYPYIVYRVEPFSQAVMTSDYRVQVILVSSDDILMSQISDRLLKLLDFTKPYVERPSNVVNDTVVLNSQLQNGGSLQYHENENVFEQIQYFLVRVKG